MRRWSLLGIFLALLLLAAFPGPGMRPVAAQDDPATRFHRLINAARLEEGLPPLGWSRLLTQAAQQHADDMATHALGGREGSDGSTPRQRIRQAGYQAWHDGLLVNEFVWLGLGGAENAMGWLRGHPEQWEMFVSDEYRELGIGYATDNGGVNYFVVDFGSRPGVLPVFINDGAESTDSPVVAVRLTNELAVPMGEGSRMGRAIDVRLSDTLDFAGAEWQPWEVLVPWTLGSLEPGPYAVYVEFRDGAGRTTRSEATIRLVAPGEEVAPAPLPAVTVEPGEMETPPLPDPTAEQEPELTGEPTAELDPTSPPTFAPEEPPPAAPEEPESAPLPTWTPLPPATLETPVASDPDWTLLGVLLLQGVALALGAALLLRRR